MHKEHWDYLKDLQISHSINASSLKYNISAQAMGKAIRTLENEIGFQVITRSYTGVNLTPQGEQALESATLFFENLEKIKNTSNAQTNTSQDTIDLYATHQFFRSYPLQSQYRGVFSNQNVSIVNKNLEEIFDLLNTHKIDYAICTLFFYKNQLMPGFKNIVKMHNFFPFDNQKLFAFVANTHPLAQYKTISLNNLFKYPFIAFSPDNSNEHSILFALTSVGIPLPKNYIVEHDKDCYESNLMLGKYVGLSEYDEKAFNDYFRSHIRVIPIRENLELRTGYLLRKQDDIHQYPLLVKHLESVNAL